ncbi:MAG: 2-oxoacid:acceptor oxidoreductase family protein, partial [Oscillospiraceae bacterium]
IVASEISRSDVSVFRVPASQIAEDNSLGGMGNIVLLGKVLRECGSLLCGIDEQILTEAFRKIIPESKKALIEKNIAALRLN